MIIKYNQKIDEWLSGNYDQDTKNEILRLKQQDPEALKDAFYKNLEFGTGGLRGIMGAGTNRMNKYTVGSATQGLANFLIQQFPKKKLSVAIAYDSRINSVFFANIAADVLTANGIYVHLFDSLRSTPELSFTVRTMKCNAGIVITASHNPKEYNGYKVYWSDGGQLLPPYDKLIIDEVAKIKSIEEIKWERKDSLVKIIGIAKDKQYIKNILSYLLYPKEIQAKKNLKIVYTPLYGAGMAIIPDALKKAGFANVDIVQEQMAPDGNFPTAPCPNPEEKDTLELALKLADETNADLVMATDPDADRLGVAVRDKNGKMILLDGNTMATLLTYYILSTKRYRKELTEDDYVVKTIVTTELIKAIAFDFNIGCENVLTGFKYIAGKIAEFENKKHFLCGGEESYGFLIGDTVRDKDANVTACLFAELVSHNKDKGETTIDYLEKIYAQYGCFKEGQMSITIPGQNGIEEIKKMMDNYRQNFPVSIAGSPLVKLYDYSNQKYINFTTKTEGKIELPKSNVLQFVTANSTIVTIRPSGTEPKIKYYFSVREPSLGIDNVNELLMILNYRIKKCEKSFSLTEQ